MKIRRKIIRIDEEKCNGCGLCIHACAEGAIAIIAGKARLLADRFCDGLGACIGECPQDALSMVEADAEAFDVTAAEAHAKALKTGASEPPAMPCGCPSTLIQLFPKAGRGESCVPQAGQGPLSSSLSHWPVQIRLVPATASFLENAHLLIAADCTPVAYAGFHQDFLSGKAVLMGCPKLDDITAHEDKLVQIFRRNPIRSITTLVMEVPCCQGLPAVIRKAISLSGQNIPLDVAVISLHGEVLSSP